MLLTMDETRESHRESQQPSRTTGRVLHRARAYDLLAWLLLRGRERAFRRKILSIAGLSPGQSVLDVGCGTGTLAILAKEHVGPAGAVHGIDASPEMIARARRKAKSTRIDVAFENAVVESLPFPDGKFDVVLSTLMLHHLPRAGREQCAREMRRVLAPGGRVVLVDFGARPRERTMLGRFHNHGSVDVREIERVLSSAGLRVEETGPMGIYEIVFVIARVP
jgi:ubiquinone/menaquinone biosynthesis C-methylase UbiE